MSELETTSVGGVDVPNWFLVELALFDVGSWWRDKSTGRFIEIVSGPMAHMYSKEPVYQFTEHTSFWEQGKAAGMSKNDFASAKFFWLRCVRVERPGGLEMGIIGWEVKP